MANVIKISDDIYEEMRARKPEDKSMQEYASEILKIGLLEKKNIIQNEKTEKGKEKAYGEEIQKKIDCIYQMANEILIKVSLNHDRLFGKNGEEAYTDTKQHIKFYGNAGREYMSEEEKHELLKKMRENHPGIIPWDEFDKKMEQAQKEHGEKE